MPAAEQILSYGDKPLGRSSLFSEVMDKYHSGLRVRQLREPDWYIAKEFYKGNHYHTWVTGRGVVEPPRDKKWLQKTRLVYNRSGIDIQTVVAYLLRNSPTFGVMPNTGDKEDQAAALLSRRVLLHYWKLLGMSEKLEEAGIWALLTGACFFKVGWNPLGGPLIPKIGSVEIPALPDPNADPLAPPPPPVIQQVELGKIEGGEVRVDVVSPFEFLPDEGGSTMESLDYALHVTMRPVDELRRLNPKFADQIQPENPDQLGLSARVLQSYGLGGENSRTRLARCLCIEYYARPSKDFPGGVMAVATRKTGLMSAGPTPPGFDHIPFSMWVDRPIPGEFWPEGSMRGAIPLQKELNARLSQSIDILRRFRSKWMVASGSVDTESQLNNEDGERVDYVGKMPQVVHPSQIPEGIQKAIEFDVKAIDEHIGALAVLQGQSEGEVRSGRQAAYLGQYGETRISRMAAHMAACVKDVGKKILMMVSANVTDERIAVISGKNREIETVYFRGEDLRNNIGVTVEVGSLMGFSQDQRFDKLMRLYDGKVIGPDKLMGSLEIEDFYGITEGKAKDRNTALRENETWRRGGQVRPPFYFEDHHEHLNVHDDYRKSAEYEKLSPEQRAAVDQHCHWHEGWIEKASMPPGMMAPPGLTPPGAPGPGGGTPPAPGGPGAVPVPPGVQESGSEIAEGLPPVPPVSEVGSPHPPGLG